MGKYRKFTPEYRGEAVKLVIERSRPIAEVARELGINEGTLGNWVNMYRREHPVEEQPLNISDRARLHELERENRELRMQAEFLKSSCLLREGASVSEKYALINAEKADPESPYPTAGMCTWLGVSQSGFYEWRCATPSAAARRRVLLAGLVAAAFEAGRGAYGARRIRAVLGNGGHQVSLPHCAISPATYNVRLAGSGGIAGWADWPVSAAGGRCGRPRRGDARRRH